MSKNPPPLRKTIEVGRDAAAAFAAFAGAIGRWWPLATHSRSAEAGLGPAESAAIEGRVGGRIYEVAADGRELDWGEVVAWEPPHRLAFTWRLGRPAAEATVVELRFCDLPGGRCQVDLEHREWHRLGAAAAASRANYDKGWDGVLGRLYRAYAEAG